MDNLYLLLLASINISIIFYFLYHLPIIIDVKKYGAKGNGYEDDTLAIQKTIRISMTIMKFTRTSMTIYFPKGSYNIQKTISIPNSRYGINLQGENYV